MRKHIIFVSYSYWPPHFGGELKLAIERFESLARRGHHITALTSGASGFLSVEETQGIKVLRSPIVGTSRISRLFRRLIYFIWSLVHL